MVAASKSKTDAVAYRWQRFYPTLQTGHYLTVKSKQRRDDVPVFFAQGCMDRACCLHVFSAALIIFDLAKHDALEDMSRRKYGLPAEVFSAFRHTFFEGLHAHDFVELVNNKLKLPLSLTLRQAADGGLDKWTVDNLMRGELLAVTFASVKNHRTKHWALCTGCEGSASGRAILPDTIHLLDPSASAPSFAYFNARLRLPTSGPGSRRTPPNLLIPSENSKRKPVHWLYEAAEWNAEEVRLLAAVRLQLKVAA